MIEKDELYDRLTAMSEEDRVRLLDPICDALSDKSFMAYDGSGVLANRILALAVIDLFKAWQREIFERD